PVPTHLTQLLFPRQAPCWARFCCPNTIPLGASQWPVLPRAMLLLASLILPCPEACLPPPWGLSVPQALTAPTIQRMCPSGTCPMRALLSRLSGTLRRFALGAALRSAPFRPSLAPRFR